MSDPKTDHTYELVLKFKGPPGLQIRVKEELERLTDGDIDVRYDFLPPIAAPLERKPTWEEERAVEGPPLPKGWVWVDELMYSDYRHLHQILFTAVETGRLGLAGSVRVGFECGVKIKASDAPPEVIRAVLAVAEQRLEEGTLFERWPKREG